MSTRCQIKITYKNQSILIYHHWDGYPEGVGKALVKIQKQAVKTWNGNTFVNELVKCANDNGYEVAFNIHTDLDYWYEINCDFKTIKCWKVKGYHYLFEDACDVQKGEEQDLSKYAEEAAL